MLPKRLHPDDYCSAFLTNPLQCPTTHSDPHQPRILSVREVLRAMSFPDTFIMAYGADLDHYKQGTEPPPSEFTWLAAAMMQLEMRCPLSCLTHWQHIFSTVHKTTKPERGKTQLPPPKRRWNAAEGPFRLDRRNKRVSTRETLGMCVHLMNGVTCFICTRHAILGGITHRVMAAAGSALSEQKSCIMIMNVCARRPRVIAYRVTLSKENREQSPLGT